MHLSLSLPNSHFLPNLTVLSSGNPYRDRHCRCLPAADSRVFVDFVGLMRVTVDLGFSSLVLVTVVCVVVPTIGFVILHKWRQAAARAEEIKMLLILVAEKSARVESEAASYQYGVVLVAKNKNNHCAMCYSRTVREVQSSSLLMNRKKLMEMVGSVRTGGKGTVIRTR